MILVDIKSFIVQNALADESVIKYDYDSAKGEDLLLLTLCDNIPCDLAMRSRIRITVKFSDLKLTRDTCFALYNLLFPEDNFQKAIVVNGKTMHIKLNQGPYFADKDPSKRHGYVLDITVTYNR